MAKVLVAGAIITCTHHGELAFAAGDETVTINGNGIVLAGSEKGLTFPAVPGGLPPCNAKDAGGNAAPCAIAVVTTHGLSTTLKVNGKPALLASATGATLTASGPGTTWSVKDAGQAVIDAS